MTDSDEERPKRSGPGRRGRFEREICFKWPSGNCPYGNRCRFAHEGPGGTIDPRGGGRDGGGGGGFRGGGRGSGGGGGGGGGSGTELFVRGLDYDMTKDEVRDEILMDLRCQEIILPQSRDNEDQNRGFAILKFRTEGDARTALDKINGTECRGRGLFARWSEDFPPPRGGWDRYERRGGGGGGGGMGFGGGGRSNECFRWSREGRCEYGRDCRFEHSTRGSFGGRGGGGGGGGGRGGGMGGGGRSDVCYAYQRDGTCSYGDSCKFVHE